MYYLVNKHCEVCNLDSIGRIFGVLAISHRDGLFHLSYLVMSVSLKDGEGSVKVQFVIQ